MRRGSTIVALFACFASASVCLAADRAPEPAFQGLDLAVRTAPYPFRSDSREMLFYEIQATNYARAPLTLETINVILTTDVAELVAQAIEPVSPANDTRVAA